MMKKELLKIILILAIISLSIIVIVQILNIKNENKSVASVESKEISADEIQIKEVDIIEPEIEETEQVISIPELSEGIYYIKVNNKMNTVTIYIKDENGDYTIPVKAMICSTGEETFKNSTYKLNYKRWPWRPLFGNVYGQYATHIDGDILFHSVPYLEKKNDTLKYWEYDKLGTTCSAGCIRLTVEDAKWIYDNCLQGSIVEFYSSEDPGPLGKPSIETISENEEYRNWDPTDPNENNPWNNLKTE